MDSTYPLLSFTILSHILLMGFIEFLLIFVPSKLLSVMVEDMETNHPWQIVATMKLFVLKCKV